MKKLAALKVYVLWSWLEQHPDKTKKQHPLYAEIGLATLLCGCPWCDIYLKWGGCHLLNGDKCPLDLAGMNCKEPWAPFNKWYARLYRYSSEELRVKREAAGEIARVAWQEYKRLGG